MTDRKAVTLVLPTTVLRGFRELCCALFRDPHTEMLPLPLEMPGLEAAVARARVRCRIGAKLREVPATLVPLLRVVVPVEEEDAAFVRQFAAACGMVEEDAWRSVVEDWTWWEPVAAEHRWLVEAA